MPTSKSDINQASDSVSLEEIRGPLSEDLEIIDQMIRNQIDPDNPVLEAAVSENTTTLGKRMRPVILLLSAQATGDIKKEHHKVAVILELIHAATLVHDDVLDQGEIRREHITVNEKFGNELAVLFGDYIFSNAYLLTADLSTAGIRRMLAQTARDVCKGEIWQTGNKFNYDISESTYHEIIQLKTASLFVACGGLGALINEADESVRSALKEFGRNFGIAFQVVDDYLDLVGEESVAGKSLGTDLMKGKVTLPVLQLFSRMDDEEKKEAIDLIQRYGRNGDTSPEVEKKEDQERRTILREAFTHWLSKYELLNAHTEFAGEYLSRAREALHGLPSSHAKQRLHKVVDYAKQRHK